MECTMIILNYIDKERALNLAQKCNKFSCINHVIIVDNSSPDNSYEWLLNYCSKGIDIIKTDYNGGFSYGNNVGVKYAIKQYNPTYVLFANTDTEFEQEDVLVCLKHLKSNKKLGLVSIRIHDVLGNEENSCWKHKSFLQLVLFCSWFYRSKNFKKFYYTLKDSDEFMNVDVVRGSFMCFKTEALKKMNFFDENTFLYFEEDIISKKLEQNFYKVGIITNHFYTHNHIYKKNTNPIEMKLKLDDSMFYFLTHYYGINSLQKIIAKIIIRYSLLEELILNNVRKLKRDK